MTSSAPIHKPVSAVSFSDSNSVSSGFVPVPRPLFDLALCHDLGKRELRLFLLVIRLTYGCRDNAWATLRPGDLSAIGIHSSHARLCMRRLLQTGLVLRDGDSHRYRANPKWTRKNSENEETETAAPREQLRALVGRHIGRSRRRSGTEGLSSELEDISEQEAQQASDVAAQRIVNNDPDLPTTNPASKRWRFDRQQERFLRTSSSQTVPYNQLDRNAELQRAAQELFPCSQRSAAASGSSV